MASEFRMQLDNETPYTNTFTINQSLRRLLEMNSSSSAVSIDWSEFSNIELIKLYSDTDFTVAITAGGSTISFITKVFVLNPEDTFKGTVTNFAITTTSTDLIDIYVDFYEKVVSA